MNYKLLITSFLLFLVSTIDLTLKAQESKIVDCITQHPLNFDEKENENKENFDFYVNEYYKKLQQKTSTAITNVPAKIHIVTDSNGGTTITVNEIMDEIQEANSYLANSFLEITVCDDINYIPNDQLYNFDSADQQLLYANNQSDIMNIYFVESISFSGGNACGYTHYPGSTSQYYDVIVMDNQCTNNPESTTLIHEFGHHFNLIHTHGESNTQLTDELVNGSNCASAGDRLCDTPADPLINNSNVSSINCLYTGTVTDALGQQFDPDTSNIMSYAPNTCTDFFSIQQYARMYAGYHIYRGTYYKCPSFNVDFSSEKISDCDDYMTVSFTDASVGAISWEWDVDGDNIVDYTDQNPTHVYVPGTYDVTLQISNGEDHLTKVFPQYVDFESNIYETSKVKLKLFIVDINENTWEFKDSNGNILYEGGPYDQTGEHLHELDIVQSECYTFTIYDTAGNGLDGYNWTVGNEYYELTTEEGELIYTNTNFGSEESKLISTEYLSLNESIQNSLSIFPNPADNFIEIRYQNLSPDSYTIYDINGRKIKSKQIDYNSDLMIDVSRFEKGMYFISLEINKDVINLKFLVK